MYLYQQFDQDYIEARVDEFSDQLARYQDGQLSEDEFRTLRLMNGLYLQLHAYMLRVAIPYGSLTPTQLRALADIADKWDRGYAHFTTRQNVQYNWPELNDVPAILRALAKVQMHAIQTSGNCIRNITSDQFAGAAADEIEDPRPLAEWLRQWSSDHAEFTYLPRKFKIAISASPEDRAATLVHDIGLRAVHHPDTGEIGYAISVGGGLGRTPMIGQVIYEFVSKRDLLPRLEAIISVYNELGRRDNKYKARIKISVHELGLDKFRTLVEEVLPSITARFVGVDVDKALADIATRFASPNLNALPSQADVGENSPAYQQFIKQNSRAHKHPDYVSLTITLKRADVAPGDASADEMRAIADIAEAYAHGDIRVSHQQNLVLPHVPRANLPAIYQALAHHGLARANLGLISDLITCPGLDYCALATAHSIPIAKDIAAKFAALDQEHNIGPLRINISGCINACGHHHVGHIGILGLEKAGVESYQITLGGDSRFPAQIGTRTGPGFSRDEILAAIERIIQTYLDLRTDEEDQFLPLFRRVGMDPFKAALYPETHKPDQQVISHAA